MQLSGEEYLRISQSRVFESLHNGTITTAPARHGSIVTRTEGKDRVEMHRIADMIVKTSDIREQVVASLRERIEAGDYIISGEQIAEMMMRRFRADRVR